MASAEQYASWIVKNADKKGTPEFDTVAKAYKAAKTGIQVAPTTPDAASSAVERADKPSMLDSATRQLGLATRSGYQGLLGIPVMLADSAARDVNKFTGGVNKLVSALGGSDDLIPQIPSPQAGFNRLLDLTLPTPATGMERFNDRVMSALASPGSGLATGVLSRSMPDVAARATAAGFSPAAQTMSTMAGAGASSVAQEAGAGPAGQMAAGIVGSMAPGVGAAAERGVKGLMRGGDENIPAMRDTVRTFRQAGTEPSVGQATQRRLPQAIESAASKSPGGAGRMAEFSKKQAQDLGKKVDEIADSIAGSSDTFSAGRAIEKGISGDGGFIDRFRQAQVHLYDKLDAFIKPDARVNVSNTRATLKELNSDIQSSPALSKWWKNSKIEGLEKSLISDVDALRPTDRFTGLPAKGVAVPDGYTLPYDAIKKMRSLVGQQLENPSLADDVGRSKWKALYASLSRDMESAVKGTGDEKAITAFSRANKFTKAGHNRIDDVLQTVVSRGYPEKIYQAATSDISAGPTKINAILRSLKPAERDVVRSAFIRRMGAATNSVQNDTGDVFSPQTFLTNFNKINPRAKNILFAGMPGLDAEIKGIASVASNMRNGSKVFSNPSGTAQAGEMLAMGAVPASVGTALLMGNPAVAASIAAGAGLSAGTANYAARKMTDKNFLSYLLRPTESAGPMYGWAPTGQQIMLEDGK